MQSLPPLSFSLEMRGWSWNVACLSLGSLRFISSGCIAVGAADGKADQAVLGASLHLRANPKVPAALEFGALFAFSISAQVGQ